MNIESLNAALVAVLNKAISAAEKGGEFLAEQIPDVVNQLLMWHMMKGIVMLLGSLLVFGLFVYFSVKLWRYLKTPYAEVDAIMAILPLGLLWIPIVALFNLTWLQILIAPKVYLIEYAASLVK